MQLLYKMQFLTDLVPNSDTTNSDRAFTSKSCMTSHIDNILLSTVFILFEDKDLIPTFKIISFKFVLKVVRSTDMNS